MSTIKKWWVPLIYDLITEEKMQMYSLVRLIHNYDYEIPGEIFTENHEPELCMTDLGYAENGTKMTLLKNMYYNKKSISAANIALRDRIEEERPYTALGFSFINEDKPEDSMGHCLQSGVLSYFSGNHEDYCEIDIFYRNTEAIQKFCIDLMFLRDYIIPALMKGTSIHLNIVRFRFSNIYLHVNMMFFLLPLIDEIEFLNHIITHDRKLYDLFRKKIIKFFEYSRDYYSYRSRRKAHHKFLDSVEEGRIDGGRLKEFINYYK